MGNHGDRAGLTTSSTSSGDQGPWFPHPAVSEHGDVNEPTELSYAKCRDLLGGEVLGRVALCTPAGPRIVPVNYALVDEAVVFRTSSYSLLGTSIRNTNISFEVDHVDYERRLGWSVVATGMAGPVEDPDEIAHIRSVWDPQPWAGGARLHYVRLPWRELSGRRIGLTHADEMAVRRTL